MIKVELSSITAIPLGNAIPSASWRTTPSGLIAASPSSQPARTFGWGGSRGTSLVGQH